MPRRSKINQEDQLKGQVFVKDVSCSDNLSCHGSICSEVKSLRSSSPNPILENAVRKQKELTLKLDLEQAIRDKERAFLIDKAKLEVELARLGVSSNEEVHLFEGRDNYKEEVDDRAQSYLQGCTTSHRQHNYKTDEKYSCEYKLNMPNVEIAAFYGDTADYWRFMKQFEYYIEKRTRDPGQCMLYLTNYCKGIAKDEIKSCIALPPVKAYEIAKKRLKERFGLPHVIARTMVDEILSFPRIHNNDAEMLSKLAALVTDSKVILEELNQSASLNSALILEKIVSKLPVELRQKWAIIADEFYVREEEPGIEEFTCFIDNQSRIARSAYGRLVRCPVGSPETSTSQKRSDYRNNSTNHRSLANTVRQVHPVKRPKCFKCGEEHELPNCSEFIQGSTDERWQWVRSNRLCFLCLKPNHQVQFCRLQQRCNINRCGKRHHETLHQDRKEPEELAKVNSCHKTEEVHLGTIPVRIIGPNTEITTYALLDNGSDTTFVKESVLRRLGIKGCPSKLKIKTIAGERDVNTEKVDLTIESISKASQLNLTDVFAVDSLLENMSAKSPIDIAHEWRHLDDLEFNDIGKGEVGLLIGCDNPEAHWVQDQRVGNHKQPFAVRTSLGWVLLGPYKRKSMVANVRTTVSEESDIWSYMKSMYDQEFKDLNQSDKEMSKEEKRACDALESGTYLVDGKYSVPLPWKEDRPSLPNNYAFARKRLLLLRKRFMRTDGLYERYKAVMDSHISKGYLEKPDDACDYTSQGIWYLPHHPVLNPRKPEKLRVVLDCAAKMNGVSLNDCLLSGPDTIADLVGVLLRFRRKAVALTADIQEMFLQVKLPQSDRRMMRLLWWDSSDLEREPAAYEMTVHPFGATSSPFCANFALKKTLSDYGSELNELSKNIASKDIYVDDCITSVDTVQEAISVANQLTNVFKRTGFRLRSWASNHRKVLESISESELSPKIISLSAGQLPIEKTLGIEWDTESDHLKLSIELEDKPETRRGILATVASMFDPLGLVCPFTLIARILLQEICRIEKGWDEPLDVSNVKKWRQWKSNVPWIKKLRFPRQVVFSNKWQLHIFSDASETGYGAVVYVRSETEGEWVSRILMAKAKVAPLKKVTVPRLELSAAVLATRLFQVVDKQLVMKPERVVFWTDSVLVLRYIRNTTSRFATFVANRVQEILEHSTLEQWRYVNTKENPADLTSRGTVLKEDIVNKWLQGPRFLAEKEEHWRSEGDIPVGTVHMELKKATTAAVKQLQTEPTELLLEHYSSWQRMKRAVAWLNRWKIYRLALMGKVDRVLVGGLTSEELDQAEFSILKYVQRCTYPMEYAHIIERADSSRRVLLRQSRIGKLNPIGRNGLVCVGSRLNNTNFTEDRKYPIILPRRHAVTESIVWDIHRSEGHAGIEYLLSILRERYWIVNAKATIKRTLRECLICRKLNAPLAKQQMAPLPEIRVRTGWRPFTAIGVDYFGPFLIKRGRSNEKRYGCLFTCMQSRAVHVELTHSMSTESFLLAMSRFIDRRGTPSEVYSDNGGNFIGADRELSNVIKVWDVEKLNKCMVERHIKWNFNPPLASHRGGVWERMIRSIRRILYTTLGTRSVDEEVLITCLVQAERIINDRPLLPMSENDVDTPPLRPSDLLRVRDMREVELKEPLGSLAMKRWGEIANTTQHFWKRWRTEYLATLHLRQKWLVPERKFKVGDLVIIWTESVPKGYWPMGIVINLEEGEDHLVRSVEIKTSKGIVKRDIRKICLLEGVD